jgi:dTMP kinase
MRAGKFITFEGISGVGRSYQAQALHRKLFSSVLFKYPNLTLHSGSLLAQHLQGTTPLSPTDQSLLFALNRWEQQAAIRRYLEHGTWVIADRYSFSGVAHARAQGIALDRCYQAEEGLPQPDIIFYLRDPTCCDRVQDCYDELMDDAWVILNIELPRTYNEDLIWDKVRSMV